MIDFNPIEINDKALFDEYFNLTDYRNSEKNFSNLFIWSNYYNYEYALVEDFLCVKANLADTGTTFYHYPYGEGNVDNVIKLLQADYGGNLVFNPIVSDMVPNLKNFNLNENRDAFDYIYTTDKLINLKGSNLRNKRRWIKKFKNQYDYTYESIDKTNLDDAWKFTLNEITNQNEAIAMNEMFNNYHTLEIKGCIIRVNDEIVGVSTGEQLTKDTVIIHCEHCNRDYEGVYNVINQDFVKNQWSEYKYVNREQDLGLKGLRQAKLTYRPDILLKKYTAKGI